LDSWAATRKYEFSDGGLLILRDRKSAGDSDMSFHFAWRLLYDRLPFMFDFASDRVSAGRWKRWGRTCISYLKGRQVVELGHGPGYLLIELKRAGYQPTGIDLSRAMGRLAARRLRRAGVELPLVRCRAQALPFRANSFDAAVATFPTDDLLKLNTLQEVARVIPQGGRLAMVVGAQREGSQPNQCFIDWLKGFIGENGKERDRPSSVFPRAGFRSRIEYQFVEGSPVILLIAEKWQRQDGWVNMLPTVEVSSNVRMLSKNYSNTVLKGRATDPDGDPLTYRWLKEQTVLTDWKAVGKDGNLSLELQDLPPLEIGQHTLTLELSDPYETVRNTVVLTIENSPPVIVPMGEGINEVGTPVIMSAHISDYDGDPVNYYWLEGRTVLASGSVQTVKGGNSFNLTTTINNLTLGVHTVKLQVSDGSNPPVSDSITVTITDTTPPRLSPVANQTHLWPPDHRMVRVLIQTNVSDNSGLPVMLNAFVSSNEPETGLGEWDIGPDWNIVAIDPGQGTIALDLRSERSERGSGRKYTVAIVATDQAGNVATTNTEILVPLDYVKLNSSSLPG
jgi:ubiquinone/menaquinone biosynthesis C-methylase UbiE